MRRKSFLLLCLFLIPLPAVLPRRASADAATISSAARFMELSDAADKALADKNYSRYQELSRELLTLAPNHPSLMVQYAKASVLARDNGEALVWLTKVVDLGGAVGRSFADDADFAALAEDPRFRALAKRAREELRPVNNSVTAYVLPERDLMSEGVAYDTARNVLYLGSIYKRKIVAVTAGGEVKDFTAEKQDGLLGVLGMEVDEKRRELWACSGWFGRTKILDIDQEERTGPAVMRYDLDTGKLIKRYVKDDSRTTFFNDLTVAANGDVYVTDTFSGAVYTIPHDEGELKLLMEGLLWANGVTLSDDGTDLFVAHYLGLRKIDLETLESKEVVTGDDATLVLIDGLAYYQGSLIAHQSTALGGIYQYFLDPSRERVVGKRPIELYNPVFDFPTTGELAGDVYYYLANAQLRRYDETGQILPREQLEDVVILKTELRSLADPP